MIDKFERLIDVRDMIQRLDHSGQGDLARKLEEKAKKSNGWDGRIEWLIELRDLMQILSDVGQGDLARTLRDEETKEFEERYKRIKQLIEKGKLIHEFCDSGLLDLARMQYEDAKAFIERYRDEQPQLRWFITPAPLFKAYVEAGNIKEVFHLFREENKELAERDKDLQDASLSEVNDVWELFEKVKKFAEKDENKQFQLSLLEYIVSFCYAVIIFDYRRGLYKDMKVEKLHGDEEVKRQLGQIQENSGFLYVIANANELKPDDAFALFQKSYRELAEMYEDKEMQDASLAFSEINDVWERHAEVKKLAEKYRNKQLQQQFLSIIAFSCSESVIYYSKIGKSDKAQALYENLKQLVETHGEEQPELWVSQAKGAGNLIYAYVTANKPDEARTVYEELRKLAEDHLDEPKFRVWQAEGAFGLTYGYAKAGKSNEAGKMFQWLEKLVKDNDVRKGMQPQKIDEMPMMDWLRQLLQKYSDS